MPSPTTIISNLLHVECDECDGAGMVEAQDHGTADPTRAHVEQCPTCHGLRWVPLACVYCGEQADVVDHDGMPKCRQAYEEDHPGRNLPRAA